MDQLSFDFEAFDFEAFNESLNVERALIAKDNEEYFAKRGGNSMQIEKPLVHLVHILYPELNETGYTTSPEVIKTGQLRLEQAVARKKSINCEYFLTWRDCLLIEEQKRTESND